ncbi:MAG: caspase family protein [Candidatus Sumerlaeota bacterium]|nr:caspase family protein [Candidatus Sumerlaeota bacterium]
MMGKRLFLKCCLAIGLTALALSLPGKAWAGRYALLVGINKYPECPLNGCVGDAERVEKLIQSKFDFTGADTLFLKDEEATRKGILAAIDKQLINKSKEGDTVLFYYSGHGTSVPDVNGDEEDGMDEAICPIDCIEDFHKVILDDELGAIITKLDKRQVVFIFDSCHSGTALRTLDVWQKGARYLPPTVMKGLKQADIDAAKAKAAERSKAAGKSGTGKEGMAGLFGGAKSTKAAFGQMMAFVDEKPMSPLVMFLAGCKADEVSWESQIDIDGEPGTAGAMTWELIKALNGAADEDGDKVVTGKELRRPMPARPAPAGCSNPPPPF